ncbi:MAG TPA: SRPBCC domain-containing protein [Galbitalea sp.]|nr:SRPBCC domain-containing protein [Galbitalea sp.]
MPDLTGPADTGKTKDAGWEVGVRTTVDAPLDSVWTFLLGPGLPLWLGHTTLTLEKDAPYATDDDISGRILSYSPGLRIRLSWQPGEWDHDSTLQLTVREAATGTTIAFHQERLSGREERKIMLGHWKDVVAQLAAELVDR